MVAPTTAPNEPTGSAPSLSRRRWSSTVPGDRAVAGAAACCTSGPSLLEVRARTKRPRVVGAAGLDHRVERAEAEVGAGGDRVGGQRRGGVEVGVGVGLAGRADVAALDVEQHQRAGGPRLGDHPLEHGDAAAAEALVERALRLDHADDRRDGLDHRQREPLQRRDVVGQAPLLEQRDVRVDADAEAAALLDRAGETGAEGGHRSSWVVVGASVRPGAGRRSSGRGAGRCRPGRWSRRRRGRRWPSGGRARPRSR